MSKITNKPSVTDNYGVNVRRAAIEQRGKWAAGFYVAAREEGIDLEPIMRKSPMPSSSTTSPCSA